MTDEQRQHCINVSIDAWAAEPIAATPLVQYALVRVLLNKVSNGSFAQYFSNSYSADAKRAHEALIAIGGDVPARVLRRAIGRFSNPDVLRDRARVDSELDAMEPGEFDSLSDEFLAHQVRLEDLLDEHALNHAADFRL